MSKNQVVLFGQEGVKIKSAIGAGLTVTSLIKKLSQPVLVKTSSLT